MLLGVALAMALVIKTFLVQAFYIPSESMEPGLVTNDRILVQKPSYWFGEPDRGDVVVFEDPGGWLTGPVTGPQTWLAKGLARIGLYPTGGHLVKRVVGVAGDAIMCCDEQGRIVVNGEPIDADDFIRPQPDPPTSCDGPMGYGGTCTWKVTVPDDRLFVMGDNRAASADSSARLCRPKQRAVRHRPGVRAGRPGRRQGVRAGVAAGSRRVRRHARRVRRRARAEVGARASSASRTSRAIAVGASVVTIGPTSSAPGPSMVVTTVISLPSAVGSTTWSMRITRSPRARRSR